MCYSIGSSTSRTQALSQSPKATESPPILIDQSTQRFSIANRLAIDFIDSLIGTFKLHVPYIADPLAHTPLIAYKLVS